MNLVTPKAMKEAPHCFVFCTFTILFTLMPSKVGHLLNKRTQSIFQSSYMRNLGIIYFVKLVNQCHLQRRKYGEKPYEFIPLREQWNGKVYKGNA